MKKLFYTLTFCSSLFLTAQTAGVFLGEGDNNGKSFTIGTNASVETVKTFIYCIISYSILYSIF